MIFEIFVKFVSNVVEEPIEKKNDYVFINCFNIFLSNDLHMSINTDDDRGKQNNNLDIYPPIVRRKRAEAVVIFSSSSSYSIDYTTFLFLSRIKLTVTINFFYRRKRVSRTLY
jgi:hypothetical protein